MARIIANCARSACPGGAKQLLEGLLEFEPLHSLNHGQDGGVRTSYALDTYEFALLNERQGGQTRVGLVQCSWESNDGPRTFVVQDARGDTRLTTAFQNYMKTRPGVFTVQELVAG